MVFFLFFFFFFFFVLAWAMSLFNNKVEVEVVT